MATVCLLLAFSSVVSLAWSFRAPLPRAASVVRIQGLRAAAASNRSSSLENIDLFASADRVKPVVPEKSGTSSVLTSPVKSTTTSISREALSAEAELLRLEAEKDQLALDRERIQRERKVLEDIDDLILRLLELDPSVENVYDASILANKKLLRKDLFFRLVELCNVAATPEEKAKFSGLSDTIMNAISRLDPALFASLTADIEKEVALELDRLTEGQRSRDAENVKVYDQVLQQWIQQTVGSNRSLASNDSIAFPETGGRAMIRFPSAVPLMLLPLMLRSPELSASDVELLKSVVVADLLNNTIVDYATFLTTFRGRPTQSVKSAVAIIEERLEKSGLDKRVRLLVLPEYRVVNPDNSMTDKYSGNLFEPVFTFISREAKPRAPQAGEIAFATVTALAAFATTFLYATDVNSLNNNFVALALAGDQTAVERVFPIVFGVLGIQLLHDLAHALSALINKVKLGIPIALPSLQIGLFGTALRFLDYPKDRKQLFDVAIAGPLVGLLASLSCVLLGLDLTVHATPEALATFPALPLGFFQSSFLLDELISQSMHPEGAPSALLPVHPLFATGVAGLLANAYNMLPIGKLDGGRVAMAIAGRQAAASISNIFLLGLGFSLISSSSSPVTLFFALYVSLFLRSPDLPPADDVTPIGADGEEKDLMWFARLAALVTCLAISAATVLPVPIDPAAVSTATDSVGSFLQGLPGSTTNTL